MRKLTISLDPRGEGGFCLKKFSNLPLPTLLLLLLQLLALAVSPSDCFAKQPNETTRQANTNGSEPSPWPAPAGQRNQAEGDQEEGAIAELLPDEAKLFQKDSLDVDSLQKIDCHLRNLDLCYAGLMSTMQTVLPETDAQLEARCDEMKVALSCLAIYNKRCQSFKIFSAVAPILSGSQSMGSLGLSAIGGQQNLETMQNLLSSQAQLAEPIGELTRGFKPIDLMSLCEADFKGRPEVARMRAKLFELAKCTNRHLNQLRPCIEDLKTALQLYFEPRRVLPLKPSCCAISRFQQCARSSLDKTCGLSSFDQLEASLFSGSSNSQAFRIIERVCRQASKVDSPYCKEVLPASGLKGPQRRGSRASKLAKALDLISLAPASADSS